MDKFFHWVGVWFFCSLAFSAFCLGILWLRARTRGELDELYDEHEQLIVEKQPPAP